jgi:hypothetical protein
MQSTLPKQTLYLIETKTTKILAQPEPIPMPKPKKPIFQNDLIS